MKDIKFVILGFALILVGSCTDFLEPYPNGDISETELWNYPHHVQGLVNQCYTYMSSDYSDIQGAQFDCATDNAVQTSTTGLISKLAAGTLTTGLDFFDDMWGTDYKAIKYVNMFLKDDRGYNTRYLVDSRTNDILRKRLKGEAYALRAWFQWDLLQKFGGRAANDSLLGFPIVLLPLDISSSINLRRNTYDECVKQIISDCDSAYKYLPIAYRDNLFSSASPTYSVDKQYLGSACWGRLDGITTKAIKSQLYLTWASPRFNPKKDESRWDSAAVNAKKVIDFKLTVDNVSGGLVVTNKEDWFNPNNAGIVFASRYSTTDNIERLFYPGGFQGDGAMGASQDLVESFPMKNGYPITDARSLYDSANPYLNRDPRFYSAIFYNGENALKDGTAITMYTFENFEGGKDVALAKSSNSRTNYYIKKFVYMGLNWSNTTVLKAQHSKFYYRWALMCLNFAEAANHVVGPTSNAKYGLSAQAAVKYLRSRNTYDNAIGIVTDPYLIEVAGMGTDPFDTFIKNERRLETCFEGIRFFDLARWSTNLDDLNKPTHGINIIKNSDNSLTYKIVEVEKHNFKSAYLPIPYTEVKKMSNLEQNQGWDSWK